jgi:hypothetical protein
VDSLTLPEENWWREDYDAVKDRPWGVLYQYDRFRQALDILERTFGDRPSVHVTPGNVYGADTDAALAMAGVRFHETLTSGAGSPSQYEPGVFWSVRTGEQELFYRQPDPDPVLSAALAAEQVDGLLAEGQPAILQTHAMNALVDGDGTALATFYDRLLSTVKTRHPDFVALAMDEMAQLERDGWSVSGLRVDRIYTRNYLAFADHEFHVSIPVSFVVTSVSKLPAGTAVAYLVRNGEVIFTAGAGDYQIDLIPAGLTLVDPNVLPGSSASANSLRSMPNPSSGGVSFSATLPSGGAVTLEIFDLQGRRVSELKRRDCPAGDIRFFWDGASASGGPVAPGVYLARLVWTGGAAQAKILLVP